MEAGEKHLRVVHLQCGQDVLAGVGIRRRGQRDTRHAREQFAELREVSVFGPELVAPLRDAVRLIDREQCESQAGQNVDRAVAQETFGRNIEEVETLFDEFTMDVTGFLGREFRMQGGGGDTQLAHGGHLVVHQRDQWRNDDGGAGPAQRGNLIADAFAAAGRHQHQRVAAGENVVDHGFL